MEGYRKLAFMNTQKVRTQLAVSQASALMYDKLERHPDNCSQC